MILDHLLDAADCGVGQLSNSGTLALRLHRNRMCPAPFGRLGTRHPDARSDVPRLPSRGSALRSVNETGKLAAAVNRRSPRVSEA